MIRVYGFKCRMNNCKINSWGQKKGLCRVVPVSPNKSLPQPSLTTSLIGEIFLGDDKVVKWLKTRDLNSLDGSRPKKNLFFII